VIYVEPRKPVKKWLERAKKATQCIIDEFEENRKLSDQSYKDSVWKKLKDHLMKTFHNKCAYCEGSSPAQAYFTVDHYRPKKGVSTDKKRKNTVKIKKNGEEQNHPGYYWLAYCWGNYLLACDICNTEKGKQFPLSDESKRACCHNDNLGAEEPLLLNPYVEKEMEKHFRFGIEGTITGISDRGKKTIDICNLNRETLQTARAGKLEALKCKKFFLKHIKGKSLNVTGDDEYSAYLRTFQKKIEDEI
jgi:hypothetical protein